MPGKTPYLDDSENRAGRITEHLLLGILKKATRDAQASIPVYDPSNTAKNLESWIEPTHFDLRNAHRNGDKQYLRSIYTAARWFLHIHDNIPPQD
jgi:hypothetical protein